MSEATVKLWGEGEPSPANRSWELRWCGQYAGMFDTLRQAEEYALQHYGAKAVKRVRQ